MQEKYEQAIKETFAYLEECIAESYASNYVHLGFKEEIIQRQMKKRGFDVYCTYNHDHSIICIYPREYNLPIHIWRKE
jgi:predicted transport protein